MRSLLGGIALAQLAYFEASFMLHGVGPFGLPGFGLGVAARRLILRLLTVAICLIALRRLSSIARGWFATGAVVSVCVTPYLTVRLFALESEDVEEWLWLATKFGTQVSWWLCLAASAVLIAASSRAARAREVDLTSARQAVRLGLLAIVWHIALRTLRAWIPGEYWHLLAVLVVAAYCLSLAVFARLAPGIFVEPKLDWKWRHSAGFLCVVALAEVSL